MSLTEDLLLVAGIVGGLVYLERRAEKLNPAAAIGAAVEPVVDYFKANNSRTTDTAVDQWFDGAEGINLFGLSIGAYDPCDWSRFRGTYIGSFGIGADPGDQPTPHFADRCVDYKTRKNKPGGLGY